jgi:tetratricopeptide (TPR) repeat protein
VHYENLAEAQVARGKLAAASSTLATCAKAFPRNTICPALQLLVQWNRHEFDSVGAALAVLEPRITDPAMHARAVFLRADLARLRGKLREASHEQARALNLVAQSGRKGAALGTAIGEALQTAFYFGDGARATRLIDEALARDPIGQLSVSEAPYPDVIAAYALAGHPEKARTVMTQWETRRVSEPAIEDSIRAHGMQGHIALAERRLADAQREFRAADSRGCRVCSMPMLGRAYDVAGNADSAIAVFERFLVTPTMERSGVDGPFRPVVHKRLGELYEAKGQREKALEHYRAFLELWKDADPELQPRVTDARQRVAALTSGTDVRR